jgi:hypothetical protein
MQHMYACTHNARNDTHRFTHAWYFNNVTRLRVCARALCLFMSAGLMWLSTSSRKSATATRRPTPVCLFHTHARAHFLRTDVNFVFAYVNTLTRTYTYKYSFSLPVSLSFYLRIFLNHVYISIYLYIFIYIYIHISADGWDPDSPDFGDQFLFRFVWFCPHFQIRKYPDAYLSEVGLQCRFCFLSKSPPPVDISMYTRIYTYTLIISKFPFVCEFCFRIPFRFLRVFCR